MPRAKIEHVISFSNEDIQNPASNLLSIDVSKKRWLCDKGQTSCSVVLQLNKAVKISSVHIGSYQAALVEVLVGRSERPNDQFQVLVPSSVFLTPQDSRKSDSNERVRTFTSDKLTDARNELWDRVRVVCTQPYNKHCKFGLSFIHLFEPETCSTTTVTNATSPASIQFNTQPEVHNNTSLIFASNSSDEDDFKPGELFAKHKNASLDTGALIRQATSQTLKNISDSATKLVKTKIHKQQPKQINNDDSVITENRGRDSLIYTDDEERPNNRIDKIIKNHNDEKNKQKTTDSNKNKTESHDRDKRKDKIDVCNDKRKDDKKKIDDHEKDKRKDKIDVCNDKKKIDDHKRDKRKDKIDDCNEKRDDYRKNDKDKNINQSHQRIDKDASVSKETVSDIKNKVNHNSQMDKNNDVKTERNVTKRPRPDIKQDPQLRPGPVSSSPHSLLADVRFALSGYVNPQRANIRDKALAMGATFLRDWDSTCTHLVCAFPNTPKLKYIRSLKDCDCVAVTSEWVLACCNHRRRLPWQWFATEPSKRVQYDDKDLAIIPNNQNEDEEDTDDEIEKVLRKQKKLRTKSPEVSPARNHSRRDTAADNTEEVVTDVSRSSDVAFVCDERYQGHVTLDSESDTDETVAWSDAELSDVPQSRVPELFSSLTFRILDDIVDAGFDTHTVLRYIAAYGGTVIQDCSGSPSPADYTISVGSSKDCSDAKCVRPEWLWQCHKQQKLCNVDDYIV